MPDPKPPKPPKPPKVPKQRRSKPGKQLEPSPFAAYIASLSPEDKALLDDFLYAVRRHLALSERENRQILQDFYAALLYYHQAGLSLQEACQRLGVENLGGFYARPPILWYSLDDAAKIYPLAMKHGQMSVFRLSAYLKAPVVPELLQMALTFTIKRFPFFATTVKKGFFWHCLDTAKGRYALEPEQEIPCRPLRISRSGSKSFRVLYYNNRISVEYFHILTDATGGMSFLKTLLSVYLNLLGHPVQPAPQLGVLDPNDLPTPQEAANEFPHAQKGGRAAGFGGRPALQLNGALSRRKPCYMLHFRLDAAALKQVAQANHATVTAYILALLFLAAKASNDELTGDFSIQVPVNMRKFHPSHTLRNFSMYCGIRLPLSQVTSLQDILPEISQQLTQRAAQPAMEDMILATESLVGSLRLVPLFIKAPLARIVFGFLGDTLYTTTLSNLGMVELPPDMAPYVDSLDFLLGTAVINRVSCAMVTYQNTATLSLSKQTLDPSFEDALYVLLTRDGLVPRVEGSPVYEN